MRSCSGCTECCTLLPIEPFNKPANKKCKHDTGHSCRIYDSKPNCCHVFTCAWLQGALPKAHRPDKTGVVVWATTFIGTKGELTPVVRATVRPGEPRVHRQTMRYLRDVLSHIIPVQIEQGSDNRLWQDGKELIQWHEDDFLQSEMVDGKFADVRVVPHDEIIATDADARAWERTQDAARLVPEPGDKIKGNP